MQFDVFNGDADGICALVQLHLAAPRPPQHRLVTGLKRDILLLDQVIASPGDQVTVLDISMEKNAAALLKILAQGAHVLYVDHHQAGEIPVHSNLKAIIDTGANTCTSLLVNDYLNGQYRAWAVTAAFGDNLIDSAVAAAKSLSLSEQQLEKLNNLGVCINYNGYGGSVADLHIAPEALFRELVVYPSPFAFMDDNPQTYQHLLAGYADDMAQALRLKPEHQTAAIAVYILPDQAWARRVSGVFGNELANRQPQRAHAVLSLTAKGDYQISVRAPLSNKTGADELCSQFPTGGGRKAAAGVNHLPVEQLPDFITAFARQYR